MRSVAVLGPGGVGGLVAAALARAGTPVTVVAREETAARQMRDGLRVRSVRLGAFQVDVRAVARLAEPVDQWRAVKTAACEAIVGAGGTITHHHAVGRDHAPYMEAEVGATGLGVLRAVKDQLDPTGIMNPGKLLN